MEFVTINGKPWDKEAAEAAASQQPKKPKRDAPAEYHKKPVRSRAYELPQAAEECKALAERSGWTHVEIQSLSKSA